MNETPINLLRRLIQQELRSVRTAELAVVQAQHASDQDNYACTVRLRDSGIVLSKVPVATPRLGTVAIPPMGTLVLLQFIGGDVNAPVIVGSLYNEEDRAPAHLDGEVVWNLPPGVSEDAQMEVFLKSGNEQRARFRIGNAVTVELQDDDPAVLIDVGGNAEIRVDSDGQVSVKSARKLLIEGQEIKLKANSIEIAADAELKLKGGVINLN